MTDPGLERRLFITAMTAGVMGLTGCLRLSSQENTPTGDGGAGSSPTPAPPVQTTDPTETDSPEPGEPATETDTPAPDAPTEVTGNWHQFQYDVGNTGHAASASGPKAMGGELWVSTFDGEFGHDSVTLADGTIYAKTNNRETLYAIDAVTGETAWTTTIGEFGGGSVPTVVGGTIYIGTQSGSVIAVSADDGRRLWLFEANTDDRGNGVMCSVTVQDELLYFGDGAGIVYAVSTEGRERWRFETGGAIGRSTPAVIDGTAYVGSMDGNLFALDAITGEERWTKTLGDAVFCSPAVADGTVFVGSITATDDGGPITIPDGDDIADNRQTEGEIHALAVSDGATEWSVTLDAQVNSSLAVANGTVYGGPRTGPFYAWDAGSGEQRWFFPTEYLEEASPAVADGVVYLTTEQIYGIDAETGRERWRYQPSNGMDTSPVIADGVLFGGDHDGNLYALYGPT